MGGVRLEDVVGCWSRLVLTADGYWVRPDDREVHRIQTGVDQQRPHPAHSTTPRKALSALNEFRARV